MLLLNGNLLELLAACQAAFVLGLTIVIFAWYFTLKHSDKILRLHVLTISCSYALLTIGTVISVYEHVYPVWHTWHYFILPAYGIGDVSLLIMLRHVAKKRRWEKENNKFYDSLKK